MYRTPSLFILCFLTVLLSGCGKPPGENFEWFRYAPPEGWEQRELPQGVSMTMPGVAFNREGGDPRSPRLVIMDVSDHKAREERVAEVFLLGRERIARNQLKEAKQRGDGEMRYEVFLKSLSLPASETTKVVQVMRTINGAPFGEWHAFLSLPGGGKVRVHFEALEPLFSELLPGVRESLQSLSFSKELTRAEAVKSGAAMDYFKSELNGERLWLSENRIDGMRIGNEHLAVLQDPAFAEVTEFNLCADSRAISDGVDVTDDGLRHLAGLPLEKLYIRSSLVEGPGLEQLKDLPLDTLILGGTLIENADLQHLEGMTIRSLGLDNTRVDDGVLPYLEALPLRYIELQGTLVSPEGVERLKALKPGITVMYY